MKIVFTSTGPTWDSQIDPRFGRARYLVAYNEETHELISVDNDAVKDVEHGAGTATAQKVYEIKPDILITGIGPGNTAASILKRMDMKIYIHAEGLSLKEAYEHMKHGQLEEW